MFISGGPGVATADAILNNLLLKKLPDYVPDIDPQAVLAVGAAGIKDTYHGEVLSGVWQAYLDSLHGG
jgi:MFS transporter, DHA2 family, glioxin efflux transporter